MVDTTTTITDNNNDSNNNDANNNNTKLSPVKCISNATDEKDNLLPYMYLKQSTDRVKQIDFSFLKKNLTDNLSLQF